MSPHCWFWFWFGHDQTSDLPPSPVHRPVSLLPAALVSSAVRSRPRSKAFGRRPPLFTLGRQILVDAGVYGGNNYTPCCCIAFAALYLESTSVLSLVERVFVASQ